MNIRDGQRKFSGRTRYNAGHHSSTLDDMSSPSDPTRHSTARYNAIVVGTGPAGLSVVLYVEPRSCFRPSSVSLPIVNCTLPS